MAVRSKRLGVANTVSPAATTVYTCPAGYRTIVKSLTSRNKTASGQRAYWTITDAGGTTLFDLNVWCATSGGTGDTVLTDCWFVLNAGEHLVVQWSGATGGVNSASGTELLLP